MDGADCKHATSSHGNKDRMNGDARITDIKNTAVLQVTVLNDY